MGDRKRILLIIVFSFCILLLGSSIFSLFLDEEVEKIEGNYGGRGFEDILNERMMNYSSGVVGSNEAVEVSIEMVDSMTNLLANDFDGYSLKIPSDWDLDDKDYRSVVHLRTDSMKLTVFRQGINLSFERISSYLSYSNANIRKNYGPITHISDEVKTIGGKKFDIVTYDRDPITTIVNDMFRYRQYLHTDESGSVFTFIVKTNDSSWNSVIDQVESSLGTFQFWQVEMTPDISPVPEREVHGIKLSGDRTTLTIPDEKMVFGLWHQLEEDYWKEVEDLEQDLDFEFHFVMDYFNFLTTFQDASAYIHKQYDEGNVMLISLQPYVTSHGEDYDGNVVLIDMLNGEYDQYLMDWAKGLKDLGEPVFLRFGNEMNGDWAQWCSWFYGLDPDLFIMAWARLHTIFEYVGADNVQFVWNPHDRTYPDYDWQSPYLYYPGDDMVDWIGMTAYNNGVTRPTEFWRDFEECYSDLYDDYMRRFSSKPFMITEFACNEIGGNKAEWIETGLPSLFNNYPNIWMAVWWNGIDETWIYDIDSTEESLSAFKNVLKDQNVLKDPVERS